MRIPQEILDVPMRIHTLINKIRLDGQSKRLNELIDANNWCLIVLDACRYDFLKTIFSQYFEGSIDPVWASGSNTFDYLATNWQDSYSFPYVTAAAPVTPTKINFDNNETAQGLIFEGEELREMYNGYQPADHLLNIDAVWQDNWDENLGVCPPEPVTKRAIEESHENSKLVAHYFQPHAPFIGEASETANRDNINSLKGGAVSEGIWEKVESGEISAKELCTLYKSNVERVLVAAAHLIQETKFDRYVIIGDHGEALGEYNRYTHGMDWHPYVRTVPWAEVSTVNADIDYMQEFKSSKGSENSSVEDRLSELGYL